MWPRDSTRSRGREPASGELCSVCTEQLKTMRSTMALLDEWQAPEPSPYFDVRLQARLREEMAKPQAGWLQWFRRPVLAAALTVLMGVGVGLFVHARKRALHIPRRRSGNFGGIRRARHSSQRPAGLDKNHDLYSDFEVLDDLDVQQDVVANP